jgi:hypothetical protein
MAWRLAPTPSRGGVRLERPVRGNPDGRDADCDEPAGVIAGAVNCRVDGIAIPQAA